MPGLRVNWRYFPSDLGGHAPGLRDRSSSTSSSDAGAGGSIAVQRVADHCGDIEEADARREESSDRDLVGGVEDRRLGPALLRSASRASASAGKRSRSGASKSSVPIATRSSRSHGVSIRSGQASV